MFDHFLLQPNSTSGQVTTKLKALLSEQKFVQTVSQLQSIDHVLRRLQK